MRLFRRKTPPVPLTRTEALHCIPQKTAATSQVLDNGDILIEYPLRVHPLFLHIAGHFHLQGVTSAPTKKIQLDQLGGMVWQMVDGKKNVGTIIKEFAATSGLTLQEAEISVTTFFRQLGRRGLILMQ